MDAVVLTGLAVDLIPGVLGSVVGLIVVCTGGVVALVVRSVVVVFTVVGGSKEKTNVIFMEKSTT